MHESLTPHEMPVAVDAVILAVRRGRLRVLLSRRTAPPYRGCWALPGRFIGREESAEKALRALLQQMLPVNGAYLEQLYTFSAINRDPRGRVISIAYLVILPGGEAAETEAAHGMKAFDLRTEGSALRLNADDGTELAASDMAFDHAGIVETAVRRLRGKIGYTDIAFRFLADMESFSLSELQTVFEAVMDRPTDSSNFRRMIRTQYEKEGRVIRTEKEDKQGPGRPSVLYRFRPEP